MKKNILEKLQDFNFWFKNQDVGIEREELQYVLNFIDEKNTVLVIAGVRRSGKTYLAKQMLNTALKTLKKEQTLYANFEDPSLTASLDINGLQELYDSYRYFLNKNEFTIIVFDEIHNIAEWEKWIRIMLEKKENIKLIVTGSSSKIFKSKISEILTGRTLVYLLYPLSFSDFLKFKGYQLKKVESYQSLKMFLTEYLEYGGFPQIVLIEKEKNAFLKQLFDDIVIKDIIITYNLREIDIRKLATLLINYFTSQISVRRLVNLMQTVLKVKLSPTSINNYLHFFEESFLFFFVPIFSYRIKDQMLYPRKVYCIDTGLINAVNLSFSENLGKVYENAVAIELIRRYTKENVFYWKQQKEEVDFVIKQGLKVISLIQVCFQLEDERVKRREVNPLLKASEELQCDELLIITERNEGEELFNGKKIRFTPLYKWLLK